MRGGAGVPGSLGILLSVAWRASGAGTVHHVAWSVDDDASERLKRDRVGRAFICPVPPGPRPRSPMQPGRKT